MRFSQDDSGTEAARPAGPVSDTDPAARWRRSRIVATRGGGAMSLGLQTVESDFDALLADAQQGAG